MVKDIAELAMKMGLLFNEKITDPYWDSYKGELGQIQSEVLVFLFDNKQATAKNISEKLNIPKQHTSKIIKQFHNEGYVDVISSKDDARSNIVVLNDKGLQYVNTHIDSALKNLEKLMDKYSEDEKKSFMESMENIIEFLSKN